MSTKLNRSPDLSGAPAIPALAIAAGGSEHESAARSEIDARAAVLLQAAHYADAAKREIWRVEDETGKPCAAVYSERAQATWSRCMDLAAALAASPSRCAADADAKLLGLASAMAVDEEWPSEYCPLPFSDAVERALADLFKFKGQRVPSTRAAASDASPLVELMRKHKEAWTAFEDVAGLDDILLRNDPRVEGLREEWHRCSVEEIDALDALCAYRPQTIEEARTRGDHLFAFCGGGKLSPEQVEALLASFASEPPPHVEA